MLSYFSSYYADFMVLAKENPVAAGVLSLYGAGVAAFFLRYIPTRIFAFFQRQCTTSLMLKHVHDQSQFRQIQIRRFLSFLEWYSKSQWFKYSRNVRLGFDPDSYRPILIPEYGFHFFFYKYRLFWFNYTKEQVPTSSNSMGSVENEMIYISTLGRSTVAIRAMIEEFAMDDETKTVRYLFRPCGRKDFESTAYLQDRNLDRLIYPDGIVKNLCNALNHFYRNPQWYADRALAYKKVICLHGPSGTGKTSLVKAIASKYKKNLLILDISQMTDDSFSSILEKTDEKTMVLIEDFDSNSSLHRRQGAEDVPDVVARRNHSVSQEGDSDSNPSIVIPKVELGVSLSGFLNALQGAAELNGQVIFLTTNNIDVFDPAVIRPSRVDHLIRVDKLARREIDTLVKIYYPNETIPNGTDIIDLPAAYIQGAYIENYNDFDSFIKKITSYR